MQMKPESSDAAPHDPTAENQSGYSQSDPGDIWLGQVARRRKVRRKRQQMLGISMLLAGYMSLAVTADTDSAWLLIRVVGGFGLLFAGFAVGIGPFIASILGDHE
jgi:hypothetical protein